MAVTHLHPKLSILAQFDDMARCNVQLTVGIEDEFLTFVKNQQISQKKWSSTLSSQMNRLQSELNKAKEENCLAETKLKHMRSLVETEMQKRLRIENEKRSLERQIAIIKEVLLADQNALNDQAKEKLAFLSSNSCMPARTSPRLLTTIEESMGSVLSSSDVSFDKTDDLDGSEEKENCNNRSRSKRSSSLILDDDDSASKKAKLQAEQNILENLVLFSEEPVRMKSRSGSTPLRRRSSTGKTHRGHVFCTKTVIRPETCLPCGKRIRFYKPAFKCQDCRATCHPECKESVPLPCIPTMQTPTSKGMPGTIADYVPASSPMVPALVIHCVNEIERRGLNEVGLYRVSGSEREVRELKERFLKGKSVPPCMSKQDIFALCSVVKEFLRTLKEPLVTRDFWKTFVDASELPNNEGLCELYRTIDMLPQPNRDTLAFLMLHLNKIACEPACKMPCENLSKVFGPTIVGYSSAEPCNADMISETKCQFDVMQLMFRAPRNYWEQFACESYIEEISVTPEPLSRPEPKGNLLGPLSGSEYCRSNKSRAIVVEKTALTPRCSKSGSMKTRRQFFSSPLLK